MHRIFCSAVMKFVLIFVGYIAVVSLARAESHTFDVMFGRFFGNWFHFGSLPSFLLFLLCIALLIPAVWLTKHTKKETVFLLWRKIDASLLVLIAFWMMLVLLVTAHSDWTNIITSFFLPLFAYTAVMLTATELVARVRDKDLLRTLYWFRFFRLYPVWTPLGLFFFLFLIGNLAILLLLTPEVGMLFGFYTQFGLVLTAPLVAARWWANLSGALLIFSALSLIALTYFAAFMLNLSAKYDLANAEKIQAERFKSELITNVSHDIKTPLTSLINYVDLLGKLALSGQAAAYVSVLEQKSARLKMLIDDLIEASKAGTANVKLSMQAIHLNEIVGQAAGEFEEQLNERGLRLVLTQRSEAIFIGADNRHLWRVLENLFSNAAKYALPGTRVFAELEVNGDGNPVFRLKNTSETPLDLSGEALTEQFIRGDRARQSEGSGLGLYIAKNLIELMGGQFHIHISGDLFETELVFCELAEG